MELSKEIMELMERTAAAEGVALSDDALDSIAGGVSTVPGLMADAAQKLDEKLGFSKLDMDKLLPLYEKLKGAPATQKAVESLKEYVQAKTANFF